MSGSIAEITQESGRWAGDESTMKVAECPSQYGAICFVDVLNPPLLPIPPVIPHEMTVRKEVSEGLVCTRASIGEHYSGLEFLPARGSGEYHSEGLLLSLVRQDDGRELATLRSEEAVRRFDDFA